MVRSYLPATVTSLACAGVFLAFMSPAYAEKSTQGRSLQGRSLQGRSLQGRSLQGRSLQGTESAVSGVERILIKGAPVQDLKLTGTVLSGSLNGKKIAGAEFVGAVVVQKDADGEFQTVISSVQPDPQDKLGEVMLYTLKYVNAQGGEGDFLCEPDPWQGRFATPVYGSWDATGTHISSTTNFMFACTSGVVAKCIRWGYRPWKTVNGKSLADYHQACTRMARADYCGDGTSHTENGTLIDMYDALGIQKKSPPDLKAPLIFEAAWTPHGAFCVDKDRWIKLSDLVSLFSCRAKFLGLLPLEKSPVDPHDICAFKRHDLKASEVLIDNQSGLNVKLAK